MCIFFSLKTIAGSVCDTVSFVCVCFLCVYCFSVLNYLSIRLSSSSVVLKLYSLTWSSVVKRTCWNSSIEQMQRMSEVVTDGDYDGWIGAGAELDDQSRVTRRGFPNSHLVLRLSEPCRVRCRLYDASSTPCNDYRMTTTSHTAPRRDITDRYRHCIVVGMMHISWMYSTTTTRLTYVASQILFIRRISNVISKKDTLHNIWAVIMTLSCSCMTTSYPYDFGDFMILAFVTDIADSDLRSHIKSKMICVHLKFLVCFKWN